MREDFEPQLRITVENADGVLEIDTSKTPW